MRSLTLEFNLNYKSAQIHFTAKYTKLSYTVVKIAYFPAFASQNLVSNELAVLKILIDVSETLFNVLDKVCISFGARETSALDGEVTDQNL